MVYVKKLWANDELIEVDELNHIEQGIYDVHQLADFIKIQLDQLVLDKLHLYIAANSTAILLSPGGIDSSISDIDVTNSNIISVQVSYTGSSSGIEVAILGANSGLDYTSTAVGVMNLSSDKNNDIVFVAADFDRLKLKIINDDPTNDAVVEVAIRVLTNSGLMNTSIYDPDEDGVVNAANIATMLKNASGNKTYADIAVEIDTDILTHKNDPSAHHTRYTNSEAIAAINADPNHGINGHHNYRTDEEIRDVVAGFIKQGENVQVFHDDAADSLTISSILQFSESERTKLNGIEDGATRDQTAEEIIGLINDAGININLDRVDVSRLDTQLEALSGNVSTNSTNIATNTADITALQSVSSYISKRTGSEIDADLDYLELLMAYNSEPLCMQLNTLSSSPTLEIVDINGDTLSTNTKFYNNHVLWGGMWRWARDRTTGILTRGNNPRGDGLALDGTMGDILTSVPTGQVEFQVIGDYWRWTVSPFNSEYNLSPCALQRGGKAQSVIYVGSFEAGLRNFANNPKLTSVSGVQPLVGTGFRYVAFTSGGTTPIVPGNIITGQTSLATAVIVEINKTSGEWTSGDAAGTLYIKQTTGAFQAENLLVSGVDCATISTATSSFTATHTSMETYGNNIGAGFGICNVHTYGWLKLLMALEFKTFDLQSTLGRGVVDFSTNTNFIGKNTGADSIYSYLNTNGTGKGNGINGSTSICWRTLENPYGNIYEHIAGLNLTSTGEAHILPETGTTDITIPDILTSYTSLSGVPATADGYITSVLTSRLGALDFIPSANTGGTNVTNFCDNFAYAKYATSLCAHGGYWYGGANGYGAGPFCLSASLQSNTANSYTGCRIEYIPQN